MSEKRKKIMICSAAGVMFITPLIVLAAMYNSSIRNNRFKPAEANIQIAENDNTPQDEQTSSYTITDTTEGGVHHYYVNKTVKVYDERNKNDEQLKVMIVPMWVDKATGEICSCSDDTASLGFSTQEISGNTLVYKNSKGETVLTLYLNESPLWSEEWGTHTEDGCVVFTYKGEFTEGEYTHDLVTRGELSKAAYDNTEAYDIQLDVLADASQIHNS